MENITHKLLTYLEQLAPFGEGNAKPAWLLREIEVVKVSWFGKNEEHVRLALTHGRGTLEAIAFFAKHDLRARVKQLETPTRVTLLAHLERDTFLGRNALRLRILRLV